LHTKARGIFRDLAKSYDRTLNMATMFQDRYWKSWLLSKAALRGPEKVLDVGCGTCVLEERLEGTGCSVVGLDLTVEMLRFARRKGLGCAQNLLNSDAEALPFADGSFDVIFSCYVAKYCDPETFGAELARVLRPGGRLLMYDFARPKGAGLPFLAFYTYGLLPLAGRVLASAEEGVAYTLAELPRIIRRSDWEDRLPALLARNHLNLVERRSLSGGAVEALVALKTA
jgi:demethylmenaquinone methyltransferase/2-methoxy-6-polyprenyl-1,4-benzoquinol methylase